MRVLELEQRSEKWHAYRRDHVMASDSAIICGVSPYSTPYELWQRKLGLIPEIEINENMQRGIDNEAKALEMLNARHTDMNYKPIVVECTDNPIFAASLDGYDDGVVVEIKCGGSSAHQMTHRGDIPLHYQYQMQHQLMVTKAEFCWFVNYYDDDIAKVIVHHNVEIQAEIYKKGVKFYSDFMNFNPPAMTEKDFVDMSGDIFWNDLEHQYCNTVNQIQMLEHKKNELREKMEIMADGRSIRGDLTEFRKVIRQGPINYKQIPALSGMNLEEYRGPEIISYRITNRFKDDQT